MNPWLRVLAAFGLAIAAALFLKVLPPLIVLVFFIGSIAAVNLGLRRKVKDERKGFASEGLGLKLEREDPFGLAGYPFAPFSRCEAGSIEDVRWGTWRGLEVKRFDLACATRAGEQVRFGCAIGPIAPAAVPLVLEAAVWGTLLGDPPFDAVEVGAADGERGYTVRCAEPGVRARARGSRDAPLGGRPRRAVGVRDQRIPRAGVRPTVRGGRGTARTVARVREPRRDRADPGRDGGGPAATRCVVGGRRGIARVAAEPSTG
jgi:hypothetical protein